MRWDDFLAEHPHYIRLGHENCYHLTTGLAESFEDKGWPHRTGDDGRDLVVVGIIENHRTADGNTCGGYASFALPLRPSEHERDRPVWTVQSLDPLTISPSLLCRTCGNHGFIRDGKWVPA